MCPPAADVALRHRARVGISGAQGADPSTQVQHLCRHRAIVRAPVAKLAEGVVAPAQSPSIDPGAGMAAARAQAFHGAGQPGDRHHVGFVADRAAAELAVGVVPPAAQSPVRQRGAGVQRPGGKQGDPALQARTSVEKLTAEGFGTLASVEMEKQDGLGQGVWKDGVWTTLLSIPRAQERFSFSRGRTIPIAFAAWDGSRRERGGEKGISTWYFLSLEQPVGPFALVSPILVVAGAAIAQIVGLRWLRRRAQGSSERVGGP